MHKYETRIKKKLIYSDGTRSQIRLQSARFDANSRELRGFNVNSHDFMRIEPIHN
jgi:hypothetical protein